MRKTALVLALTMLTLTVTGEEKTHREWFREALTAAEKGDLATYASSMAEALEANTIDSNRPFMLYHLARARVLLGDDEGALEALRTIWDDDIERLLVFYVEHDPAFEKLLESEGWLEIAGRVASLELEIEEVREGLYSIDGAGSWILALSSEDGWLLVDTGYSQASTAIRDSLDSISTRQVAVIVNTHEHEDHVGGNERFGGNAIVAAHPQVMEVLSKEQEFIPGVNLPPKPPSALPNVLTEESLVIPFGKERVHVIAIPAHSGSDLAVVLEKANVVHMGDGFFPGITERIFPGKNPETFLGRMEDLLSMTNDETIVFSGHSAPVPVSELRQVVANTASIWNWTTGQLEAGVERDALMKAAEKAGHPSDWVEYFVKLKTEE